MAETWENEDLALILPNRVNLVSHSELLFPLVENEGRKLGGVQSEVQIVCESMEMGMAGGVP